MKFESLIQTARDQIVAEWERSARALAPDERQLTPEELRDFVNLVLDSIVHYLQAYEGRRRDEREAMRDIEGAARAHAGDRLMQGFTLSQLVAEYRNLRGGVTRRWLERNPEVGPAQAEEIVAFNEAVDASMGVAIAWFDDRLRQAHRERMSADRAKDEFLAVLGHELRNPLAPIRTGVELLERAKSKPELLDTVQPMMDRQVTHLTRLVDDLVDLARINRGQIRLQPAPLNLNAPVEAAIEQLSPAINERQHRLIVELSPRPLMVSGDFERLTQIVSNLLSNACRYTPARGRITIRTGSEQDKEAFALVKDAGFGIPPDRLDEIFQLFTQIPEHRESSGGGGLGIGLAFARQLIEMHGGSIEAKSRGLGHGSEFVVRLPLTGVGEAAPRARESGDEGTAVARRVLIVDDNADAANALRLLIETMGHSTQVAYAGLEALRLVEDFDPEVVLLDLGLPGMDGAEVAERIRSQRGGRDLMLISVTAWTARGGPAPGEFERTDLFDERLTKPVDAVQLEAAIEKLGSR